GHYRPFFKAWLCCHCWLDVSGKSSSNHPSTHTSSQSHSVLGLYLFSRKHVFLAGEVCKGWACSRLEFSPNKAVSQAVRNSRPRSVSAQSQKRRLGLQDWSGGGDCRTS
ncbi:hypothetical protein AAFF_G00021830, partial [Aldrovandia affinis]